MSPVISAPVMQLSFTCLRSPFKSSSDLASRLCKAAMLHRFKLLAKGAQREDLLATSSYREAKVTSCRLSSGSFFIALAHSFKVLFQNEFLSWKASTLGGEAGLPD